MQQTFEEQIAALQAGAREIDARIAALEARQLQEPVIWPVFQYAAYPVPPITFPAYVIA